MDVLIAYATRYGATAGIAAAIADHLREEGHTVDVRTVDDPGDDLGRYDAFVVGSALYVGHWRRDAVRFVRDNRDELRARPTWLFSSGPLGTDPTDAGGRDLLEVTRPVEFDELTELVAPRGHRVFFGALDPATLGLRDRAIRRTPVGRELLPEGDFRDWADIAAWAATIAATLGPDGDAGHPGAAGEVVT